MLLEQQWPLSLFKTNQGSHETVWCPLKQFILIINGEDMNAVICCNGKVLYSTALLYTIYAIQYNWNRLMSLNSMGIMK